MNRAAVRPPVAPTDAASNQLTETLSSVVARYRGDWQPIVSTWQTSAAGRALISHVDARIAAGAVVFPAQVLRALEETPLASTRVVLVGQDPYHGPGQAEGLAFSVPEGIQVPPSLRNVFKELERDLAVPRSTSGSLQRWAAQGVLLLNAVLTVEQGAPGAHAGCGWEALTDALIAAAAAHARPKAFLLWGTQAQAKRPLIDASPGHRHLVLTSNHPSPLSALRGPQPFAGHGHFGNVGAFLAGHGDPPVRW